MSPVKTTITSKPASAMAKTNASAVKSSIQKPTPPAKNTNTASKSGVMGKPNTKTEFAQDMTKLDDVAIMSDILGGQKGLIKLYGTALCETSCEKLRKLVSTQLCECGTDQFDMFLYLNQRNQYPTEPAPSQKVTEAKQKFAQKKTKMQK